MDFYHKAGPMALGSRLRRLSEQMTLQSAAVYQLYDLDFEPRWFPVFYTVAHLPGLTVGEVATRVGHTHAAVSQVVKALVKNGLLSIQRGEQDQRHSLLSLSELGEQAWARLQEQIADVRQATDELLAETRHNIWEALGEVEYALSRRDLPGRVQAVRRARVAPQVRLLDFEPQHQADFKRLNCEWIERYFQLEEADLKALDHPQEYILDAGGQILLAEYEGQIVGTCALLKMDDGSYELAKMAVAPAAQGLHIGYRLGQAAIERARQLGARRLYLESNTRLAPALSLYHKLGFQKIVGALPSPYARCNIQMELLLA